MNTTSSLTTITIKPIEINSKSINSQNWMNSPKSQHHIKLFKQTPAFQPTPTNSLSDIRIQPQSMSKSIVITNQKPTFTQNYPIINNSENTIRRQIHSNNYMTPLRDHNNTNNIIQNSQINILNSYDQMQNKLDGIQDRLNAIKDKMKKKKEQRISAAKQDASMLNKTHIKSKSKEKQKGKSKEKDNKKEQESQALKQLVSQVNCSKNLKSINFDPYTPKSHHIYYVSEILRAYKEQNSLARDHLINSLHQLRTLSKIKGPTKQVIEKKQLKLDRKNIYQGRKTVIFDLDQTLIHCNQNSSMPCDLKLNIKITTGQSIEAGINIRPHAVEILKNLYKNFQLIVFTASHPSYANEVINYLDPHNQYISHRLFREHCYQTPEGVYIKDLRIMNRQLSQTVLIDNAAYSYALQIQNGIPIIPYYQGKLDFELKALQKYIEGLLFCKDVRDANRNTFMLNKYQEFDHPDTLVKTLYGDFNM